MSHFNKPSSGGLVATEGAIATLDVPSAQHAFDSEDTGIDFNELCRIYHTEFQTRYPEFYQKMEKQYKNLMGCCQPSAGSGKVHYFCCTTCGHEISFPGYSCGQYYCPTCQHRKSRGWISDKETRLLPVKHYFITFTLPSEFRNGFSNSLQRNASVITLINEAAWKALGKLYKESMGQDLKIGMFSLFHSWNSELLPHYHIHALVTAGGLDSRCNFVPVVSRLNSYHLSQYFRDAFMNAIKKSMYNGITDVKTINTVDADASKWHVHVEDATDIDIVLKYFKAGICLKRNSICLENGLIDVHSCTRTEQQDSQTCFLDPVEFIYRYLTHILPPNTRRYRDFGIYHSDKRNNGIRALYFNTPYFQYPDIQQVVNSSLLPSKPTCPVCREGHYKYSHQKLEMME